MATRLLAPARGRAATPELRGVSGSAGSAGASAGVPSGGAAPINDAAEDVRCVSYNKTIVATVDAHAKKGQAITTVDLHSAISTSELADKLHPNDVGYGKVAKVFFDAIQKLNF